MVGKLFPFHTLEQKNRHTSSRKYAEQLAKRKEARNKINELEK